MTTGSISRGSIRQWLDYLQPSDTVLKPGDVLVAVVKDDARKTVQQICGTCAEKSA